ncbi:MAG: hypothetical protein OEY40_06195 [Candidatus Bathyarchaeota archaeon]|nr:hypothetical protein [Candidatus Bathyarchaeota archaeon]
MELLNRVPRRLRFTLLLFATKRKKFIGRSLTVAVALITLSLAFFSFHSILGQFNQTLSIGSRGIVKTEGVGVYWDSSCSNAVSWLDWGTIEPGSTKNVSIYLRNEGNYAVSLSMFADNWYPSDASSYMALSWDYAGQTVDPQDVVQTTLALSTSSGIEGITDFSFDIIMRVSG